MRHEPGPRSRARLLIHRLRAFGLAVSAVLAMGCASSMSDVGPADIPRLSAEAAARPDDLQVRTDLGIAQYRAGDLDAALASLSSAVDEGHVTGPGLLHLGLVHETRGEWAEARDAYGRFLDTGAGGAVRDEIEGRLRLMGRNLLREQARAALDREQQVADAAEPTPRSIAVLPFGFNSERSELEPLVYALADMMSTDFAVSNALVVLERAQVQTLLDEMALTEAGYAEAATGARAGRLLRAEHVVQGVLTTLGADQLRTDANVMNVSGASSVGELNESAALEQLFDMEKALVIRTIRDVLGVELTPAEEQAILDNRMDNVLAFVSYGEGLRDLDRGDYGAAADHFRAALSLEGSNPMIESALETSTGLELSGDADTEAFAARASGPAGLLGPPDARTTGTDDGGIGGAPRGTLANLTEGIAPTRASGLLDLGSTDQGREQPNRTGDTERQPIAEATGAAGLTGGSATIRLVIPSPGGGW